MTEIKVEFAKWSRWRKKKQGMQRQEEAGHSVVGYRYDKYHCGLGSAGRWEPRRLAWSDDLVPGHSPVLIKARKCLFPRCVVF